jgi:hypothetical protein
MQTSTETTHTETVTPDGWATAVTVTVHDVDPESPLAGICPAITQTAMATTGHAMVRVGRDWFACPGVGEWGHCYRQAASRAASRTGCHGPIYGAA